MNNFTGSNGTLFNYNSDFSGDVIITRGNQQFSIPGTDLLELVAYGYVRANLIRQIEESDQALIEQINKSDWGPLLRNSAPQYLPEQKSNAAAEIEIQGWSRVRDVLSEIDIDSIVKNAIEKAIRGELAL